jgi:hypothetical protein
MVSFVAIVDTYVNNYYINTHKDKYECTNIIP